MSKEAKGHSDSDAELDWVCPDLMYRSKAVSPQATGDVLEQERNKEEVGQDPGC